MNITKPDKDSAAYRSFTNEITAKIITATQWLTDHQIEYVLNYWLGKHLYRVYIPKKELLLDFEWYPVYNFDYGYIRINYNTDIIRVLEQVFPRKVLDTTELDTIALNRITANRFFRENGVSPIYDRDALRLAWYRENTIYQCVVIQRNKIIANVTKRNYAVGYGTYVLLRQLNEIYGWDNILIKENLGDSYANGIYQILHIPIVHKTSKKRIWWNPNETKWHIKKEQTDQFIPFYFCEDVTYRYPN